MKPPREKREGTSSATITHTLLAMLGCSLLVVVTAYATDPTSWNDPSWWSSPGTGTLPAVMDEQVVTNGGLVTTNYITNQYAVVVQGQLKQFTARAVDEMNAYLPNGAGTNLNALVQGWSQDYATNNYTNSTNPYAPYNPRDFTAMNVGQLKQIGSLVWSQLVAQGYTNAMPSWLGGTNAGDYNGATVGQLKTVFNFDLSGPGEISTVTGLTSTLNSDGSLTLNWSFSGGAGGGGPVVIYGTDANGNVQEIATLSSSTTSATLSPNQIGQSLSLGVENAEQWFHNWLSNLLANLAYIPSRYVVYDLGTNFTPIAINNSNTIAGDTGGGIVLQVYGPIAGGNAAVWSGGSLTNLPPGPYGAGTACAINDSGVVAGFAEFNYPLLDPGEGVPASLVENHACSWASATAGPTDLDAQLGNPNSIHNIDDSYWSPDYTGYNSFANAINSSGIYGTISNYGTEGAQFAAGTDAFDPSPVCAGITSAAGTNYCGYAFGIPFTNGAPYLYEAGIINAQTIVPDSGYNYIAFKAINASGVAVGWERNYGYATYANVVHENGTNIVLFSESGTDGPFATLMGLNNKLATNGAPAPQVVGIDSTLTNALIWDYTTYNGTPTGTYVQKSLSLLVPGSDGTNPPPWYINQAYGINDAGAIVGTANYSGTNTNIATGSHGVLLLPLKFTRETTPGSGDFEPITDNGLDDQAQLPIFASETGQGMTETDTGGYTLSAVLSTDLTATSTASINVTYSISGGGSYTGTLTETAAGSGVFQDSGGTNVLTLTPSNQTTSSSTTLSTLSATITIPSLSISSEPVILIEAQPLNYQAATVLTDVALAGTLSTTVVNSITVTFHSNFFEDDAITLTETGVNTRVFKDSAGDITLTMSGFTGGTTMNISVSGTGLTPSSFGSTLTETSATSLQYSDYQRSYGTAPNYTPATDGQGVFYVQFPGSTATSITLVSGSNSVTATASPVSGQPGLLRTGKLVLLEPGDTFSASGITTLTVSPPTGGGNPTVQLQMYGQTIVDPGTVHDAYLGFGLGEGDGSVHLGQIKNILAANASSPSTPNLGWTVPTVHGVSVKSDVLNELPKHSLWYIFTHGLTADGHNPPLVSFRLYNSSDPNDHKQAELFPSDVSANIGNNAYQLVFFNGCFSADPSAGSAAPAFATNFKADVYVGWSTAEFDIFAYNAGKIFFTTLEQHNSIQNALNAVNNTRAWKTTAQLRVIGDPTVVAKTIIDKSPIPPQ